MKFTVVAERKTHILDTRNLAYKTFLIIEEMRLQNKSRICNRTKRKKVVDRWRKLCLDLRNFGTFERALLGTLKIL